MVIRDVEIGPEEIGAYWKPEKKETKLKETYTHSKNQCTTVKNKYKLTST